MLLQMQLTKKQEDFDAGDDVSDEKLLLRTAVSSVLGQLEKEDVNQEALDNVAEAVAKIDSLAQFEKFLNYIADFEEYSVIYQYLVDTIDVIETNLGDMQAQKEDEEHNAMAAEDDERCPITGKMRQSEDEIDLKKADLDKDGKVSEYERARAEAAFGDDDSEKNERKRAGQAHSRAVADHYEDEESNLENTPLEELSTLTPEEYEMVQNFENFDADDWGYNKLQRFYFRKREGGEDNESREKVIMRGREAASTEQEIILLKKHGADAFEDHYGFEYPEEDEEFSTNRYMSSTPTETREENEEVRMSQLEINQHLAVQERQRLQNLYAQQRRHTHGY